MRRAEGGTGPKAPASTSNHCGGSTAFGVFGIVYVVFALSYPIGVGNTIAALLTLAGILVSAFLL